MSDSKQHSRPDIEAFYDKVMGMPSSVQMGHDMLDLIKYAVSLEEQLEAAMDCMNYAWTIICNVSEGDWAMQQQEWQDAAAGLCEQYHVLLASNPASEPNDG